MLAGTQLGVNAKDEIVAWLREMEIVGLRNGECLYFQQAARDLEQSNAPYFAQALVETVIGHLRRCLNDPTMVEYQGRRIAFELQKLGGFQVALANFGHSR